MADKGLITDIVNQGLLLEFSNVEIARKNLANARNLLKKRLEKDPSLLTSRKLENILGEYLDELEVKIPSEMGISNALNRGAKDGKMFVGDSARIPKDSDFWGWIPSIPLNAISFAESEMADLIRKTTSELKEKTLRAVQSGLALGADIGDIQNQILGLGIRGLKGKDGIWRSATNRAEMQARTITNDLINRGSLLTYNQVDQIVPELGTKKVWQTVSDKRTSERCVSLNGQIRPLKEEFRAGDGWSGMNPPSHPNCRSRVTATTKKYEQKWEDRWIEYQGGEKIEVSLPLKVEPKKNPRKVQKKEINPTIRGLKEDSVAFLNPNYNVNSLNSALQEMANQDPELARGISSVLEWQEKRKLTLLVGDKNYAGVGQSEQISKFKDIIQNKKTLPGYHKSLYNLPGESSKWFTLGGNSFGHTGYDHSFILMKTDELNNKKVIFDAEKIRKNASLVSSQQKKVKKAVKEGLIERENIKEYMNGVTSHVIPSDELDYNLMFINAYVHEIGHQVQNTAYKIKPSLWDVPKAVKIEDMPSIYAAVNNQETFAEGFYWYIFSPDEMKEQSPDLYNWINETWNLVK